MLPVDRPGTQAEVWEDPPPEAAHDAPAPVVPAVLESPVPAEEPPLELTNSGAPALPAPPHPPPLQGPAPVGGRARAPGGHREGRGRVSLGGSRSHSRLPAQLNPDQVLDLVRRERREALDVRDPIAIALAAERFNTMAAILAPLDPAEMLDLHRPLLSVSQTAKMLGYNAKEVRRLLGQGKIAGRKVGNEWRIPLWAVL